MSALRCRSSADLRFEPPPVVHERPEADRHQRQRDQRQPPVEPHHHHEAAGQEQHVADPGQRRFGGDTLNLADVAVDARDDVAEPRARIEPRRQPLQVLVERQPHVEQDVRRHARVAQAADDVQHEAEHAERRKPQDDAAQRREVAADRAPWSIRSFVRYGHRERRRRADEADGEDERQPAPVRRQIGEGPTELRVAHPAHCAGLGSGRGRLGSEDGYCRGPTWRAKLHFLLAAVNRAPVLVVGDRHAAFDTDAGALDRFVGLAAKNSLQQDTTTSRGSRTATCRAAGRPAWIKCRYVRRAEWFWVGRSGRGGYGEIAGARGESVRASRAVASCRLPATGSRRVRRPPAAAGRTDWSSGRRSSRWSAGI